MDDKKTAVPEQSGEMTAAERRMQILKSKSVIGLAVALLFASMVLVVHNNNAKKARADKTDMAVYAAQSLIEARQAAAEQQDKQQISDNLASAAGSSSSVTSSEHMSIVQDTSLKEVAEPPKTMTQLLQEMAGNKKEEPTVRLSEKEMSAPITSPSAATSEQSLRLETSLRKAKATSIPDYTVESRIFRDADAYREFTASRPGPYPAVDFDTQYAVMLVSNSELPSKALEIVDVSVKDKVLVKFRVNPSKIGGEGPEKYPVASFPKSELPVFLEQTQ